MNNWFVLTKFNAPLFALNDLLVRVRKFKTNLILTFHLAVQKLNESNYVLVRGKDKPLKTISYSKFASHSQYLI